MGKLFHRVFNLFLLAIGVEKAERVLWQSLEAISKKTYKPGGEGETKCWAQIKHYMDEPVVIDVGANVGKLTEMFLKLFPNASIYAIEPIPEFFEQINDKHLSGKFNIALSDEEKVITLHQSGGGAKPLEKKVRGKRPLYIK